LHWALLMTDASTTEIDALGRKWDVSHRLTVRFDENGVVSKISVEDSNCTAGGRLVSGAENCLSSTEVLSAEEEERRARLAPSPDDVVARYDEHVTTASGPRCELEKGLAFEYGDSLVVTRHDLRWHRPSGEWKSLQWNEVQDDDRCPARRRL
jgi:hypothetical protein